MNYIPRLAAIVARNESEAAFAESTVTSFGLNVSRFDSTTSLTNQLQSQAASGEAASTPDIVILAGSASDLDREGVDQLASIVPVVVTTSAATVPDAVDLMKQGAKDVVVLPCSRDELWQRVSETLKACDAEAACKALQAELRARMDSLTAAENDVVDAMLDGLANKQIAQRLGIGLRTVELRRSKIMRKMQARSVAELVKFICMSGKLRPSAFATVSEAEASTCGGSVAP
ncbi:response regulator transcription factor [Aeoliella mucimassa]|uniref:Transcriptional regulatory protein FixJ n=1 Tax=Aeoliella mucimassa TaxID=2527972 RepID=A0A518AH60_9BACT|nr:LuxR C-terminal-related transcriptional regulator [Aeoliella mucimassa]QDU54034.1 Transcriptional regulatory protein FixJ [Aeoliella mucimassa]